MNQRLTLHAWVAKDFDAHKEKDWEAFVMEMEHEALPNDWLDVFMEMIQKLRMNENEDFKQ